MSKLLAIEDLSVAFRTLRGEVTAADRLSLDVDMGETVAIVGEFGLRQEHDGPRRPAPHS